MGGQEQKSNLPVSAIIPTLNAAACIARTTGPLQSVAEIIVSDGGSTDGTRKISHELGCRVIEMQRGRGQQFAAGIAMAHYPWLLLIHADTMLQAGWDRAVQHHITNHSSKAGWFRFELDSPERSARRLEQFVAWRCRVLGLPYGDQGLLIHRDLLNAVGGVRPLPLMEDVDLIRRLGRRRLVPLDAAALTSAARWERDGWLARSARNLLCLTLWFAGVPPSVIARIYG
ncbi:MAG: TIGR04283 family arsenosugar biosynthesis glycosyltransferase [Acetobacteraceae bacterium]|nr:TIGR04283 family arsenosugar biosynthesis glycosyltransferase [Acetobacteraceae bacterium]